MAEKDKRDGAYELVGYLNEHGEEKAAELVIRYANEYWSEYNE